MNVKNTALRLAGAAMIAVALAPWVGGAAANAAVTVYLDKKWTGTDSETSTVTQAGCAYAEVQQEHAGQGWHFVLPGGDGLTTFTANFQSAGQVTVTTTETASGVIVQGGKGAVVYTPTDDVLVSLAAFADHAGQGSAATAGNNDMQLSHLCNGEATPTETPTPSVSTTTPATVTTTPATVTTTPATVTSTPASVLATTAKASPAVSVKGTKAGTVKAVLPHTGSGVPVGLLLATSLALLLGGGALMMLPGLAPARGKRRRH
jgi:hypothetical protein